VLATGPTSPVAGECYGSPKEVASLIRRTRVAAGLTQLRLARLLGCSQSVVARWETGDHEITLRTMARIADALGIELLVRFGEASEVR
jgi:transcriptional regulator with XRE-family HTH domain